MVQRREFLALTGGVAATTLAGCLDGTRRDPSIHGEVLTLTTTTSADDTGLVRAINEGFEERFGATVESVARGTGAALETGRRGDADVVMVHARSLEDEFLRQGHGINRRNLMFNDLVVVGPADDPAGIDGMADVTAAFQAIADTESGFVSRGDNSGTYRNERDIWAAADVEPEGSWYRSVGSGMGEALNQADLSADAYTLSDRGTYIAQRSTLDALEIRVQGPIEGGPELLANPYGIVAVNPARHGDVEYDLAMAYIGFLTSRAGQELIESYTVDGEQLFFPDALAANPNFQQYVPEDWSAEE